MNYVAFSVYQRPDQLWAWRLTHSNGHVLATDGGQGYENRADAESIGRAVCNGKFGPF